MEKELGKYLKTDFIGRNLHSFGSLPSTNIEAKKIAKESPEGTVVVSEGQTSGKGRLGRSWVSPKGKGIWMSMILKPNVEARKVASISLVAAAAVSVALKDIGIESGIKWPNDILVDGKKVAGILSEASFQGSLVDYVVLGIGINVNLEEDDFPETLKEKASSLKLVKGHDIDRIKLITSVLNHFEKLYQSFMVGGDLSETIEIVREGSVLKDKQVKILGTSSEKTARVQGIDGEGKLVVKYENGSVENLAYGEVSVRGLDGYI